MFTVLLVVLAVAGAWALAAVGVAFLAGGMIRARDDRDASYGDLVRPRPINPLAVARLAPARIRH